MASLRHLRRRLRSIQSTKQIMRAMQLVSASKLKRAQTKLVQVREVFAFLDGLLRRVLASGTAFEHPLLARGESQAETLVCFSSDAGLCGSYNANLLQHAEAYLRRDTARRVQLVFIGKKGHRYFTKRGYEAVGAYLDLAGRPNMPKAEAIGRTLIAQFLSGKAPVINLLYPRFVSSSLCRPVVEPWLPVRLEPARPPTRQPANAPEYIFEPSPARVFEDLLPRWTLLKFQLALLETFTSEHSARMIAMKNATDNAEELLNDLTRQRNRVRQAAITKELSEIVGTVEALK